MEFRQAPLTECQTAAERIVVVLVVSAAEAKLKKIYAAMMTVSNASNICHTTPTLRMTNVKAAAVEVQNLLLRYDPIRKCRLASHVNLLYLLKKLIYVIVRLQV